MPAPDPTAWTRVLPPLPWDEAMSRALDGRHCMPSATRAEDWHFLAFAEQLKAWVGGEAGEPPDPDPLPVPPPPGEME